MFLAEGTYQAVGRNQIETDVGLGILLDSACLAQALTCPAASSSMLCALSRALLYSCVYLCVALHVIGLWAGSCVCAFGAAESAQLGCVQRQEEFWWAGALLHVLLLGAVTGHRCCQTTARSQMCLCNPFSECHASNTRGIIWCSSSCRSSCMEDVTKTLTQKDTVFTTRTDLPPQ